MTDDSTSVPVAPASRSVVLETNAVVKISKRPIYLAVAAVVAFVAFSVTWFAVKGSDEYQPGPLAQGFVDELKAQGGSTAATDAELRCIDDRGEGIDPDFFLRESFDVLEASDATAVEQEYVAIVLDECLSKPTRVALLASGMDDDGSVTNEQATCLASAIDDAVIDAGGYRLMAGDEPSDAVSEALFTALFAAMAECGLDVGTMMGGADA
jgi:hypothetical protein